VDEIPTIQAESASPSCREAILSGAVYFFSPAGQGARRVQARAYSGGSFISHTDALVCRRVKTMPGPRTFKSSAGRISVADPGGIRTENGSSKCCCFASKRMAINCVLMGRAADEAASIRDEIPVSNSLHDPDAGAKRRVRTPRY
jgi:hypothetical protein